MEWSTINTNLLFVSITGYLSDFLRSSELVRNAEKFGLTEV